MGMGTVLFYNSFISCADYFNEVNQEVKNVSGQISSFIITALFLTSITLLPISTFSGNYEKAENGKEKSRAPTMMNHQNGLRSKDKSKILKFGFFSRSSSRVVVGFLFSVVIMFIFLIQPQTPSVKELRTISIFIGIADAITQSGLYVFAASYHQPTYSAAATVGVSLSGLFVSILRLITRGAFDDHDQNGMKRGANLLLWFSFVFMVICVLTAIIVTVDRNQHRTLVRSNVVSDMEREDDKVRNLDGLFWHDNPRRETNETSTKEMDAVTNNSLGDLMSIYLGTLQITWKPVLSVFLNLFITLALFPEVVTSIPSSDIGVAFGSWLPIILITVFNAGDCAGRALFFIESCPFYTALMDHRMIEINTVEDKIGEVVLPCHVSLKNYNKIVWIPTLVRLIFFPLLIFCIIPTDQPHPFIHSDLLICIIVFLFAFSSGFVHCANFTCTPTVLSKEDYRNAASLLLLLSTYFGLTLGSYFGLFLSFL